MAFKLNNLIPKIFDRSFVYLLIVFCGLEIASELAFFYPTLAVFFSLLIFISVFILTLIKTEWGIYIALVELIIGGLGYLFFLPLGDFRLSIRLLIFTAVMLAWLIKTIKNKDFKILINKYLLSLLPFIVCLLMALFQAFIYDRPWADIYTDANNYLFLFLILPAISSRIKLEKTTQIILAGSIWLAFKTALVLFLFSHNIFLLHDPFYKLIRDTGIGEIALINFPLFRIFFQSHFYNLLAVLIIIPLLFLNKPNRTEKIFFISAFWFNILALLISQSKTFWLAGVGGLLLFLIYLIWQKAGIKRIISLLFLIVGSIVTAHLMINLIITDFKINLFYSRLNYSDATVGVSSRSAQIRPALEQIKQASIIGWGFNKTITYNSDDPRIKNETNPEGVYATDALELGYLDILLKMGILGLFAYSWFLIFSLFNLYKKSAVDYRLIGFVIGLIGLVFIHALTPYLNHPLGIGYLIIIVALLT